MDADDVDCKYDLRKGDLFGLSLARVQRVMPGSVSLVLIMCGRGMLCVCVVDVMDVAFSV